MPEPQPNAILVDATSRQDRRSWFTSALLMSVTMLIALACIVVLSCTLTQTRVAGLLIDGVPISIPKLDYVGRQWASNLSDQRLVERLTQVAEAADAERNNAIQDRDAKTQNLETKLGIFLVRRNLSREMRQWVVEFRVGASPRPLGSWAG